MSRGCCPHCVHRGHDPEGNLECWRNPPQIIGQPIIEPPVIPAGPARLKWLMNSVRPRMREVDTCGEFEKDETVGQEGNLE